MKLCKDTMSNKLLAIDVGMYDGSDTAYYLHCGFRVIAIEANHQMVKKAQSRFSDAINNGQLTILNVAIAQNTGISKLYISNRDKGSSTMDRQKLEVQGEDAVEEMEVKCVPFSTVLEEYGSPYYLKIDIEGSDRLCLDAIDSISLPNYVSWEGGADAAECLDMMHKKGYTRFKIIQQSTFYDVLTMHSIKFRINRKLRRSFGFPMPLFSPHSDWTFTRAHSAGPCCEYTSGQWLSFDETIRIWQDFCQSGLAWYDIHAALPL